MNDELIPLTPSEGVERFLAHRKPGVSKSTYRNNRTTLDHFLTWCAERNIGNLNDLTGRDMADYVAWRRQKVKPITLQKSLSTIRVALGYWADLDAVSKGLREKVHAPEIVDGAESRDSKVSADRAEEIIRYLDRYHYASREHAILSIFWETGMRLGALRALDVDDLRFGDEAVQVQHRPESDTPLKNGKRGERWVWLGPVITRTIEDYVQTNREDVTDEYGRRPLFTSKQGRLSKTGVRNVTYRCTHPCMMHECPHDRDPETCEALGKHNSPSKCPSAKSPHSWRRGAITDHLIRSVSPEIVSERMNVSLEILYKHYDARNQDEKMAVRRKHLMDK